MATLKTTQAHPAWANSTLQSPFSFNHLYHRYLAYADTQQPYHTAWWLVALLAHSCFLVPLSFLLIYSLNGPVLPFLGISMLLFFANIVANMGGASTRFTIFMFWTSVMLHAVMIAFTLLTV